MTATVATQTGAMSIATSIGSDGQGRAAHGRELVNGGEHTFGSLLADVAQQPASSVRSGSADDASRAPEPEDGRLEASPVAGVTPRMAAALASAADAATIQGTAVPPASAGPTRPDILSLLAQLAPTSRAAESRTAAPATSSSPTASQEASAARPGTEAKASGPVASPTTAPLPVPGARASRAPSMQGTTRAATPAIRPMAAGLAGVSATAARAVRPPETSVPDEEAPLVATSRGTDAVAATSTMIRPQSAQGAALANARPDASASISAALRPTLPRSRASDLGAAEPDDVPVASSASSATARPARLRPQASAGDSPAPARGDDAVAAAAGTLAVSAVLSTTAATPPSASRQGRSSSAASTGSADAPVATRAAASVSAAVGTARVTPSLAPPSSRSGGSLSGETAVSSAFIAAASNPVAPTQAVVSSAVASGAAIAAAVEGDTTPALATGKVTIVDAASQPAPSRLMPAAVGQGAGITPPEQDDPAQDHPARAVGAIAVADGAAIDAAIEGGMMPALATGKVTIGDAASQRAPSRLMPAAVGQGAGITPPAQHYLAQDGSAQDHEGGARKGIVAAAPAGAASDAPSDAGLSPSAAAAHVEARPAAATGTAADMTGVIHALAGAVTTLASDASAEPTPVAARPTEPPPATPPTSSARSMTLQLAPADLGTVTVHLRLRGGGLDVHLSVEDQTTLGVIANARDDLASAIGTATTPLTSLVIQAGDAPSPTTAGSHDFAHTKSGAGDVGQESGAGRSGGRGAGGDGSMQRQSRGGAASSPRDLRGAGSRTADGLFV